MIFTDLNNKRYANALSVMIQEHFELLRAGIHATLPEYPCYNCEQIKVMDQAGSLDGIVYQGFGDYDLRPYDPNDLRMSAWWDYRNKCVDPDWLKAFVYKIGVTV